MVLVDVRGTIGHTATMRRPASRVACNASPMRIVARPRPSKASSTSVWVKTRWPFGSANSVNPTTFLHCDSEAVGFGRDGGRGTGLIGCHWPPWFWGWGAAVGWHSAGRGRQPRHGAAITVNDSEAVVVPPTADGMPPSSWLRPTKFHHITSCSANGCPPSNRTRAGPSPRLVSASPARPAP